MKRILITLGIGLTLLPALAQDRIFVVTDRPSYLAGDLVFCSLFCTNESGALQDFSAVSYLELISNDGTAAQAKIGLLNGRGAGSFRIPSQTPTGNYRLVAYTARSQASLDHARVLSIFNTSSTQRVSEGVRFVKESDWKEPSEQAESPVGGLDLTFPVKVHPGKEATLFLSGLPEGARVAVSIFHDDHLAPADGKTLAGFLVGKPAARAVRSGEYEGEIIQASVEGLEKDASLAEDQVTAFLSSAGDPSNIFIGRSDQDGHIRFFTDNIYGNHELVCEVVSMQGRKCHINLTSPFTHPEAGEIPALDLCPAQRSALIVRKDALKAQNNMVLDTLVQYLPARKNTLLAGAPDKRYILDHYNRFPSVREICVEFIPELEFVRKDQRWRIRMIVSDGTGARKYVQDNILVMMDGVILTDHSMLESFDAMLLEDIDIYSRAIVLGSVAYNGAVNFVSKKNYVTALHFPDNVRVMDFQGVSYPVAYTGALPQGTTADKRQLLYWHPDFEIPAQGAAARIQITTPLYSGAFKGIVEGLTGDGKPVRGSFSFVVE